MIEIRPEVTNMWNDRYSTEDYLYGTEPNDFLRAQAELFARGGRVLCLGEGEGRNAVYLAEQGLEVTAVDSSSVGLAKAQRLAQSRGVSITTVEADLADFELGHDRWEGIVSIFCHLSTPVRRALHRRVVTALKSGGLFVLEAFRPEQLRFQTGGPPDADLLVTEDELREDLTGLHLDEIQSVERPVTEGQGHTGKAAVVQVLGLRV